MNIFIQKHSLKLDNFESLETFVNYLVENKIYDMPCPATPPPREKAPKTTGYVWPRKAKKKPKK